MKAANKQRLAIYLFLLLFISYVLTPHIQAKHLQNGFDLSGMLINPKEVYAGGPVKDGIPSIDQPKFIRAEETKNIKNSDRVLGLSIYGIAKAYPINILDHHEVVNDKYNGKGVTVTYCPLCGSGTAFLSEVSFGVSGLLYNNDVLLYDRETHSLWSQILSEAVSGELKGNKLELLPLAHSSWEDWKNDHPSTLVLSYKTGFNRDYSKSPYVGYDKNKAIYFPIKNIDKRYHPKERTIGIEINNNFKAYPFTELQKNVSSFEDNFNGVNLIIKIDSNNNTSIYNESGIRIPTITSYWFAWLAFHPDSEVYQYLD